MWQIVTWTVFILFAIVHITRTVSETTTGKAVKLLTNGEAAAYEREYQERIQILEDAQIQDVVFLPYEHQPEMLYVGDLGENPEEETNQKVAKYFHKKSVRVIYDIR